MANPLKPCNDCGTAPKEPGQGKRYCTPCHERRLSLVEQAEIARSRKRGTQVRADRHARGVRGQEARNAPKGKKWCPSCEEYRELRDFPVNLRRKDGRGAWCRPCQSNYHHGRRLQKVFNLTAEQYDELLQLQDGRCAICLRKPRRRRLAVDHDHQTGEIRGLLCGNCNHKILGAAHEDGAILRRAARYLDLAPAITGKPLPATDEDHLMLAQNTLYELAEVTSGLPFVVLRCDGQGPAVTGDWPVILRLEDFTGLLHEAGYGDPQKGTP